MSTMRASKSFLIKFFLGGVVAGLIVLSQADDSPAFVIFCLGFPAANILLWSFIVEGVLQNRDSSEEPRKKSGEVLRFTLLIALKVTLLLLLVLFLLAAGGSRILFFILTFAAFLFGGASLCMVGGHFGRGPSPSSISSREDQLTEQ